MTLVTNYLEESAAYMSSASVSAIEALSDREFTAVIDASDLLNGGESEPGIDNGLIRTSETLEQFDQSRLTGWAERGYRQDLTLAGLPAVKYENAQKAKGEQRVSFIVIDFGEFRVVVL